MEAKNKHRTSISDGLTTVYEALGFIFRSGYFGRSEYVIPKETQLTIEESDMAFGNSDGFENEDYYTGMRTLPCFDGWEEEDVRALLSKHQFHIPCGKTDLSLASLEAVYEMRQKYGIRKFLLLTSDAMDREQLCRTISVMQHHFSDKYYGLKLNIMLYNSDTPAMLRTFALSDDIQLLIINKEYFIRSNNRIKRPSPRLDGLSPVSILRPARCVAITVSETLRDVRTVLRYASVFDPLCTVSFTKNSAGMDGIVTLDMQSCRMHTTSDVTSDAGVIAEDDSENFHISI